jgi:hypothetical protein
MPLVLVHQTTYEVLKVTGQRTTERRERSIRVLTMTIRVRKKPLV